MRDNFVIDEEKINRDVVPPANIDNMYRLFEKGESIKNSPYKETINSKAKIVPALGEAHLGKKAWRSKHSQGILKAKRQSKSMLKQVLY